MPKNKSIIRPMIQVSSFRFQVSSPEASAPLAQGFKTKGFTLIELILYVALVGILLTAAAIFATDVVLGSVKGRVKAQVQSEARFALEKMRQEIVKGKHIVAPSKNTTTTADSAGSVGGGSFITIGSDGLPIVSYGGNGGIKILKCGNNACDSGNTITTVVGSGALWFSSTIGSDGLPIVSYVSDFGYDLKILKCSNNACSDTINNIITTVDSGYAYHTSTTIGSDGLPIVSYSTGSPNWDFKILKCSNNACSDTVNNIITTIESVGDVGQHSSIVIGSDGLPIVSYWDGWPNYDLKVLKCGNNACNSGNTITTADSNGYVGSTSSITIGSDGLPIVSYAGNGGIRILKCGNSICNSGNTITIVNSNEGSDFSIAVGSDGLPIVSYSADFDPDIFEPTAIKVLKCSNLACSDVNSNTITIVDNDDFVGDSSIAIGSYGYPIISYSTSDPSYDLKILKCGTSDCSLDPGNVLKLEIPGSPISTLTCFQVSNNVLQMSQGGTVSSASCDTNWKDFTSQEIEVTAINFTNISSGTSLGEEAVKISLTAKKKNPGGKKEFDAAVTVETSISLRL